MSRMFSLLALSLLMFLILRLPGGHMAEPPLSLLLGFLMLVGFILGKAGAVIGLPGITSYLIAGCVLGPSVLGVLDRETVGELQLINSFALALIALHAGGEVNLGRIRKRLKSFGAVVLSQTAVTFAGMLCCCLLVLSMLPTAFDSSIERLIVASLLFAVVALANSPSSSVAVIVESRARGRVSEMVLAVTIVKDLVVIVAFAFAMAMGAGLLRNGGSDMELFSLAGGLGLEIGGSLAAGVALGAGIIAYMRWINLEIPLFIIALSFLASKLSALLQLHPLLVCMTAGLAVSNLSSRGGRFISEINRGSLPVYVVFFAIAGAGLDLGVLAWTWKVVVLLVAARSLLTWLGTWLGTVAAGEEPLVRGNLWLGYFAQAGVALGMAVIVADRFPEWGVAFKNVVIGSIVIFQLAGPVALKYGLQRAGEIPGALRPGLRDRAAG